MTKTQETEPSGISWGGPQCGKLMGRLFRQKVHLQPRGGHTYYSHYPVTGVCRSCRCRSTVKQFPHR